MTVKDKVQVEGDNQHQAVNRYKKARKIANTLRLLGVTDVSPEPTSEQLSAWAGTAGVNVPSLTTWAVVREMLKEEA